MSFMGKFLPTMTAFALMAAGSVSAQKINDLNFTLDPSGHTPLAGQLTFTTDVPTIATLEIENDVDSLTVTPNEDYTTEHDLMVLGLRPDRTNTVQLSVKNRDGETTQAEPLKIKTAPLPEDFPPIDLKISRSRRMEPGYTLVPFFKWPAAAPDRDYGLVVALDAKAEVVWFFKTDHSIGDLIPTNHGTFTYQIERSGLMAEIDMLGNTLRKWHTTRVPKEVDESSIPVDTDTFHHDHQVLENGNFLMLSTEVRDIKNWYSSETDPEAERKPAKVIGDVIVEFRPDGSTVREVKVFDILDPYRIGFGSLGTGFYAESYKDLLEKPAKDWTHTNSIFYSKEDDAVVLSSYHQDVVYKVDMKTGRLIWLMGNHDDWAEPWQEFLLTPKGDDFMWNYSQHSAKLTPHGTLILFDNGTNRARPFHEKQSAEDSYSRAVEFAINEETMEVTQVWSYGGAKDEIFFSPFISEVDWLPNKGNILITDGGRMRGKDGKPSASIFGGHHFARVLEVTHETPAEKVFEIVIDDPAMGWAIYRSERIPSLYR